VHVIEYQPLYRVALGEAVDAGPDLRLGVAVPSVEQFVALRALAEGRTEPGAVVTLDLWLPGVGNADAVSRVVQLGFRVLVISASSDRPHVRAALDAGARGYLTKDADGHEVRRALRTVAAGGRYLPTRLYAVLREPAVSVGGCLSNRERQVLALVATGERDQDIANTLAISIRTVRSHLDRIREKTGRRRRPDLTRLAIEKGIVREDAPL
jgi:DNA-binding NarL/FixJ family response regulator